jgi:hypothetical protein
VNERFRLVAEVGLLKADDRNRLVAALQSALLIGQGGLPQTDLHGLHIISWKRSKKHNGALL